MLGCCQRPGPARLGGTWSGLVCVPELVWPEPDADSAQPGCPASGNRDGPGLLAAAGHGGPRRPAMGAGSCPRAGYRWLWNVCHCYLWPGSAIVRASLLLRFFEEISQVCDMGVDVSAAVPGLAQTALKAADQFS